MFRYAITVFDYDFDCHFFALVSVVENVRAGYRPHAQDEINGLADSPAGCLMLHGGAFQG